MSKTVEPEVRSLLELAIKIIGVSATANTASRAWTERAENLLGIKRWSAKRDNHGVDAFQIEGPQWMDIANIFHVTQGASERWEDFNSRVTKVVELLNNPIEASDHPGDQAEYNVEDIPEFVRVGRKLEAWGFHVSDLGADVDSGIWIKTSVNNVYVFIENNRWMVKQVSKNGDQEGGIVTLFNKGITKDSPTDSDVAKAIANFLITVRFES